MTLIDGVGTVALMTHDLTKFGVSVEMNVNVWRPVRAGEVLVIESTVLRCDRCLEGNPPFPA